MTRQTLCQLSIGVVAMLGGAACAPADVDDPALEDREGAILNGTATADGLGYAYLQGVGRACSGTFLSSGWILTAGHCLMDQDGLMNTFDFNGNPTTWVNIGNTTNNGTGPVEAFIHPRWWAKDAAGTQIWTKDPAYDLSLLRVATPFSTVGYPHQLVSYPAAFPLSVGDTVECRGYGSTSMADTGGGKGKLQKALLRVTSVTARPQPSGVSNDNPPTADMVQMAPNAAGQQIFHGDSGGGCFVAGWPNHLVGVTSIYEIATGNGYLTKLATNDELTAWIDYVLYSAPSSLGLPFATPKPDFVSAVSTPSSNGTVTYVVAGYKTPPAGQSRLWMKAFSDKTAPSAWGPLSTTGLPAGAIASRVGLGASSVSPGAPWVGASVVGSDGNMYTAIFGSGFGPSSSWTGFTWASAGKPAPGFLAGGQPAMASMATGGRFDLFALGADSKVYTRWNAGNVWRSNWMLLPGANNQTFAKGLNVTYDTVHQMYFLAAVGDGTASNPNTGMSRGWLTSMSNVTLSTTYGNNWTAWEDMGGGFRSSMAVTSWLGALTIYGVGMDDHLYHANFMWDGGWTNWLDLGKGTFNGPYGVTSSTNDGSATKLNVVAVDATQTPVLLTFPR